MNKNRTGKQGFLLMEVLVALAIMAAGILFLLQSFSGIIRSNRQLRNNQSAFALIDAVYNRLYAGETVSPETAMFPGDNYYTWSIESTPLGNQLQRMVVRATWVERGNPQAISFPHTLLKK